MVMCRLCDGVVRETVRARIVAALQASNLRLPDTSSQGSAGLAGFSLGSIVPALRASILRRPTLLPRAPPAPPASPWAPLCRPFGPPFFVARRFPGLRRLRRLLPGLHCAGPSGLHSPSPDASQGSIVPALRASILRRPTLLPRAPPAPPASPWAPLCRPFGPPFSVARRFPGLRRPRRLLPGLHCAGPSGLRSSSPDASSQGSAGSAGFSLGSIVPALRASILRRPTLLPRAPPPRHGFEACKADTMKPSVQAAEPTEPWGDRRDAKGSRRAGPARPSQRLVG